MSGGTLSRACIDHDDLTRPIDSEGDKVRSSKQHLREQLGLMFSVVVSEGWTNYAHK